MTEPIHKDLLFSGPAEGPLLMLAHGAGAAMTSPFMELMADLLAVRGLATVRFEFGYMAARRAGGKKRPPPKAETLMPEYRAAVAQVRDAHPGRPLVIGGKSMGGRVASYVADALQSEDVIKGLVCLGYPFHPPNQRDQQRTAHLVGMVCPALIVQGERDPFGGKPEVATYGLSGAVRLHWAGDGDHDLGPRGGSGFTRKGNLAAAADAIAAFVREVAG